MANDSSEKHKIPAWIGQTPFPPSEKREKLIKTSEVSYLYGFEGNQVENQAFVSTDSLFVGEWVLPPGTHYDPPGLHLHGDECYFVIEGEGIAFNPETGETFSLSTGDALLIPQGTRHQIFNFNNKRLRVISCVAPKVWAEDTVGIAIPKVEKPRLYIPKARGRERTE